MENKRETVNEEKTQKEEPKKKIKEPSKKKKKFHVNKKLLNYLPLITLGAALSITTVIFLIRDIREGWNGAKTLTYSFLLITLICWLALYPPMYYYLVSNNRLMIKSNNELFAAFEAVDNVNKLSSYKQIKDNQAREKQLAKINNYLLSKRPSFVPLSHDGLKTFMTTKEYLKKPLCLEHEERVWLHCLYNEYAETFSLDYEKKYSDYKTRKMIKRDSFPLFSTILPFILSAIGLFGLLYQDISATESQKDTLIMYIIFMGEIVISGILMSSTIAKNSVPVFIEENNKEVEILHSLI